MFGAVEKLEDEIELPSSFFIGIGEEVQDQSLANTPSTRMACGSYMIAHGVNGRLPTWNEIRGNVLWKEFVEYFTPIYAERGLEPIKDGSVLQDQLRFARHKGYIKGRVKLTSSEQIDKNLYRGRPVVTGSDKINWAETKKSIGKIAVIDGKKHSGHFFDVEGWVQDLTVCKNSYGKDQYDKGYFYVPKDQFTAFYSVYALILDDDTIQVWLRDRNKKVASAMDKIKKGTKLTPSEVFNMRNWGLGHLLPKNGSDGSKLND